MKSELTYNQAFSQLKKLVELLEDGDIQLDQLTLKVRQANDLIALCEAKLRKVEQEVQEIAKTTAKRKKS